MGERVMGVSSSLCLVQAEGIRQAALHACKIGLPFNRHLTIRLEYAGISDARAKEAVGKFLTFIRDWLRKKGHRTAYAWARENSFAIGSHVHILLHIPAGESLSGSRSRRWLVAISGQRYRSGTIHTSRISGSAYEENLGEVVGYLIKGAAPDVVSKLSLSRRKAGGRIIGKRVGWSENVGVTARRRWGPKGEG